MQNTRNFFFGNGPFILSLLSSSHWPSVCRDAEPCASKSIQITFLFWGKKPTLITKFSGSGKFKIYKENAKYRSN